MCLRCGHKVASGEDIPWPEPRLPSPSAGWEGSRAWTALGLWHQDGQDAPADWVQLHRDPDSAADGSWEHPFRSRAFAPRRSPEIAEEQQAADLSLSFTTSRQRGRAGARSSVIRRSKGSGVAPWVPTPVLVAEFFAKPKGEVRAGHCPVASIRSRDGLWAAPATAGLLWGLRPCPGKQQGASRSLTASWSAQLCRPVRVRGHPHRLDHEPRVTAVIWTKERKPESQ